MATRRYRGEVQAQPCPGSFSCFTLSRHPEYPSNSKGDDKALTSLNVNEPETIIIDTAPASNIATTIPAKSEEPQLQQQQQQQQQQQLLDPADNQMLLFQLCSRIEELSASQAVIQQEVSQTLHLVSALATEACSPSLHNVGSSGTDLMSKMASRFDSNRICRSSRLATGTSRPSTLQADGDATASQAHGGCGALLPRQWPACIKLRSGLEDKEESASKTRNMLKYGVRKRSNLSSAASEAERSVPTSFADRWIFKVFDPSSWQVIMFEMIGLAALANDLLITPYALAWDLEMNGWMFHFAVFSAMYWTGALLFKFKVGYFIRGELKMRQVDVCRHYLKRTFIPDVALAVVDWMIIVQRDGAGVDVSISKIFRVVKILRLARVMELVERLLGQVLPQNKLAIRLFQVVFGTLICTHMTCCAWYAAGHITFSDTGRGWLDTTFDVSGNCQSAGSDTDCNAKYDQVGNEFRYLTSFHWTLAQITLGAISIEPSNSLERAFCIFLLMIGVLFNATVVSLVSSQTMEYVTTRQAQLEMVTTMRRFLDQNKVDLALQGRVRRQLNQRLAKTVAVISEQDVAAMKMLSTALRNELLFETRVPHLLSHPLLQIWSQVDEAMLRTVCQDASRMASFKPQDLIFMAGQEGYHAYYIVKGQLRYSQDSETSYEQREVAVRHGVWVAESVLWTYWQHVGRLEAEGPCLVLLVSAADFVASLGRHPGLAAVTCFYGRSFHMRIVAAGPPHSAWPNDLLVPHTAASDLISNQVGLELLARERKAGNVRLSHDDFERLAEEIREEKCAIQVSSKGDVERIVALVVMRLRREEDGRILTEVATLEQGVIRASCAYPGKKRQRGELPTKTCTRILQGLLAPFADAIELTSSEEHLDVKASESFGILTRYLKTTQYATLKAGYEEPALTTVRSRPSARPKRATAVGLVLERMQSPAGQYFNSYCDASDEDLREREVFLLEDSGKQHLMAWLYPGTVDWLNSAAGFSNLTHWMQSLDVSLAASPAARDAPDHSERPRFSTASLSSGDPQERLNSHVAQEVAARDSVTVVTSAAGLAKQLSPSEEEIQACYEVEL